jgi:hypothetical protein
MHFGLYSNGEKHGQPWAQLQHSCSQTRLFQPEYGAVSPHIIIESKQQGPGRFSLLNRFGGENLQRGFESLPLRHALSTVRLDAYRLLVLNIFPV